MATASSVTTADHSSGYVSVWLRPPEQQAASGPAARAARAAGGKWALTATLGTVALASLLPEAARYLVCSCIPLWAVLCAHYWFCLATRGTFKASDGFVVALSGIVGDLSAGGVAGRLPSPAGLVASTAVWAAVCLSACAVAAPRALGVLPSLAALRLVALVSLVGGWPCWVRATIGHLCGLCGLLAARFTEAQLRAGHVSSLVSPDGRLLAVRRRRTGSSPGLHGITTKGRRTSLPVLGQRQQYYGPGYQGSSSTVDVALLAEAHGLVTDMLLDPNLPPHVPKGRSFSTTAIPSSALSRRGVRERKTVCSLHPLSLAAGTTPGAAAGEAAASADQQATLPSVRRLHTSDYDSSNDSPSGSDTNDPASGPNVLGLGIGERGGTSTAKKGGGLYVGDTLFLPDEIIRDPLLGRIAEWDYPIFDLNRLNPDTILSKMCYRVFLEVGLFDAFKIPEPEFLHYFHALESGYREKPYHNRMHAADVLHGVYYLTSQAIPGFVQAVPDTTDSPLHKTAGNFLAEETYGIMGANFPALELMALYTAAAMHDYDHPGRTNAFLVSTYAPQAVLYNDRSVLENYHAASAWTLFLSESKFNFLVHLDKAEFKRFRFLVIECILATDLKRHFEILAEFNAKANDTDAPGIDWNNETDRLLVMEMAIKLADINGPCKRHDIHVQWTYRIAEEFYEQGDEEATLGMQVSPFMDRCNPQLAKLQESFINHLVAPLCNAYGEACLLPGHWVEASDSEDEGGTDKTDSQTGRDTEEEMEAETSASGRPWKRPSQQLQPRKVSCLQTKHLQDNYEHWVNILKEENRLKEQQQQQQQGAAASSSSTSPRATTAPTAEEDRAAASEDDEDDDEDGESDDCDDDDDDESQTGVVGADVVVAAAPSPHQEEMETIQEVEEGALGGQGSTKTSPCSGSC
ncbi:hypothetical protein MTO96_004006 [Rhipicephalus appendiculatus]